ncbi:MAG: FAD binding domain-containing protein [bacterium]
MLENLKAYHKPQKIEDAISLINDEVEKNIIIGGGSFLAFSNDISIDGLVDISKLNFDKIDINKNENKISIGSKVSLRRLQKSKELSKYFNNIIGYSASKYLSALHRNQTTVGGILNTGFANTEFVATLIGLDANIIYQTKNGEESINIKELYKNNPQNIFRYAIIKKIEINIDNKETGLLRIARTENDLPIISVVYIKDMKGNKNIVFTSIANLPIYYEFDSSKSDAEIIEEIKTKIKPQTDIRGSEDYRKEMSVVLTKRLLKGETL